jgi:hypothetical protein
MWEVICRLTPYDNFPSQFEIMKHILIDQGRPNLKKVPKDVPPEVSHLFYFILFI